MSGKTGYTHPRFTRSTVVRRRRAIAVATVLAVGLIPLSAAVAGADASPTSTATATASPTDAPSATPTEAPSATPSQAPTPSTATATATSPAATATATATEAPTPSATPTGEPAAVGTDGAGQAAAAGPDPAAPQAVPVPGATQSVITVKAGSDRTGVDGVTNLAGVVLGLFTAETGGTQFGGTCTSDVQGDCSFTVDNTQLGGANNNRHFWVRQVGAPTGYYTNPTLRTGQSTASQTEATPYSFEVPLTAAGLQGGQTYSSTTTGSNGFMLGTGPNVRKASGGIWQDSRNNPVLPSTCGLRVGLVIDFSGSTSGFNTQLKQAADTFVDSLVGTPSSMSLFSFSVNSPAAGATQNYPDLTPVSTAAQAAAFKARYAGWTSQGGTNWDRGLASAAEAANKFDIVVMITDGAPTNYSSPPEGNQSFNRLREVENGIFSANAIKAEGTRVITVGVGDAITADPNAALNIRSISGQVVFNGSNSTVADYYLSPNYAAAGDALKALAQGNCTGSVSVIKQVVPSTAPAGSITGAQPAGGWTFAGVSNDAGVTIDPPTTRVTATGTGAVNFPLTFAGGVQSGALTFTETQQAGYTLQQVGGANAVCTRTDTGASIPATNSGALGFQVTANITYPVTCTVYNRAPSPQASVVLEKTWSINGQIYPEGLQPAGFVATGSVDGTVQGWNVVVGGFTAGQNVSVDETTSITGHPFCSLTSRRLTSSNGTTVDLAMPAPRTLEAGLNRYGITNVVVCESRLTLVKAVEGGDASPDLWTLNAVTPSGALPGPSGTTGVSALVTPNVSYPLNETGGDPRYVQFVAENAVIVPPASGSWDCVEVDAAGNVIPGYADGLNGAVSVPLGNSVRCTTFNETATLALRKFVNNTHGGTATAADFTLTATPVGPLPLPAGLGPVSVTGSEVYQTFNVRPDVEYALTEQGPAGYRLVTIDCYISAGTPRSTDRITVPALQSGNCTYVNEDLPATLTLVKTVTNDNGGTALPTALDVGRGRSDPDLRGRPVPHAVTAATVNAGHLHPVRVRRPGRVHRRRLVLHRRHADRVDRSSSPLGGDVTCTINNNDQPAKLTLVKTVTNDNGGTAVPTAWTLAAAGPTPISGSDRVARR